MLDVGLLQGIAAAEDAQGAQGFQHPQKAQQHGAGGDRIDRGLRQAPAKQTVHGETG